MWAGVGRLGDERGTRECPHGAGTSKVGGSVLLVDLVPSYFAKHIKKAIILTFMAESALLSQVRKGPGDGAGSGVSGSREELNNVPQGTREGTVHVSGPCKAKQRFKVPLHGNTEFY